MFTSKKRLILSTLILVIAVSVMVVFVPSWKIEDTVEETVQQLDKKYNEQFTMTWSDLEQQPLATSFTATVQSKDTGIVYDVIVAEEVATIDYDLENHHMAINKAIEQQLAGTYALSKVEGVQLHVRLLTSAAIEVKSLAQMAKVMKQQYMVQTVTVEVIQLNAESYETATDHIAAYYQRSTVPADAFELYEHTVQTFTY